VVANAGHSGYFRTLYAPADLAALRAKFPRIADEDRLGILNDTWALGETGRLPASSYLELASAVPGDADPLVLRQVAVTFARIDRLFDGSREQSAWRGYARERLRPVFERVGWLPVPRESETTALLRESLIRVLGRLADPDVIAAARERFSRAAKDTDALPAGIRDATISVVARHADLDTWNEILARARAVFEPIEKERLYAALGRAVDPTLAVRALEYSLNDEMPGVFATGILQSVSVDYPELAFEFAVEHEVAVSALVEEASRWAFIPSLAAPSHDPALATMVSAYAERHVPADARQSTERAVAEIGARARAKARQLPELEAWVRARPLRQGASHFTEAIATACFVAPSGPLASAVTAMRQNISE
jgi:aminopeptidase N